MNRRRKLVLTPVYVNYDGLKPMNFLDRLFSRKPACCVNCGSPASFGYSLHAESDRNEISSICLSCLKEKLATDYARFDVFQPSSKWADSKLMRDAQDMLATMQDSCARCGTKANFLWLTSKGLEPKNLDELFAKGVAETLFHWGNPAPHSVCGRCCVDLIGESIEGQHLTFAELCGPHSEDGLVLPMAY